MIAHSDASGRCWCRLCPNWWTEWVGHGPPYRFNTPSGVPIALLLRKIDRRRSPIPQAFALSDVEVRARRRKERRLLGP